MVKTNSEALSGFSALQYVVVDLCGEEFAFNITKLKEIIPYRAPTIVPNVPEYIEGVINVRGAIITVISLEKMFQLKPLKQGEKKSPKHIIITDIDGKSSANIGLIVDEVKEIIKPPKEALQKPSLRTATGIHPQFLEHVIVSEDTLKAERRLNKDEINKKSRLILEIDLENILDDQIIKQVTEPLEEESYDRKKD